MIIGIGTDITDIRRIDKVIERHGERFLDRIFTADRARARRNAARNRVETYAKRFAAKEACAKALGTGSARRGVLARHGRGQPAVGAADHEAHRRRASAAARRSRRRATRRASTSRITDEGPMAQAFVVISAVPVRPVTRVTRPSSPDGCAHACARRQRKFVMPPRMRAKHHDAPSVNATAASCDQVSRAIACVRCQRLQGRGGAMQATTGREADERDDRDKSGKKADSPRPCAWSFTLCIIALVIRTFLFQPFNIPSGSMMATLLVGDYLFVSKYSYGYSHYSLPVLAAAVLRPHPRPASRSAATSSCSACRGRLHRLHQARHRPARRPHPDDRRRPPHQRRAGQARAHRRLRRRPRTAPRSGSSAGARRCRTASTYYDARSRRQRLLRQHRGL